MTADQFIQAYEPEAPLWPKKPRSPFISLFAGFAMAFLPVPFPPPPEIVSPYSLSTHTHTHTQLSLSYTPPFYEQTSSPSAMEKETYEDVSGDSLSLLTHDEDCKAYRRTPIYSKWQRVLPWLGHLLFLLMYTIIFMGVNRQFVPWQKDCHRPLIYCMVLRSHHNMPKLSLII